MAVLLKKANDVEEVWVLLLPKPPWRKLGLEIHEVEDLGYHLSKELWDATVYGQHDLAGPESLLTPFLGLPPFLC